MSVMMTNTALIFDSGGSGTLDNILYKMRWSRTSLPKPAYATACLHFVTPDALFEYTRFQEKRSKPLNNFLAVQQYDLVSDVQ